MEKNVVWDIYQTAFETVTEKLAGFSLSRVNYDEDFIPEISIIIYTKGAFYSRIECLFSFDFYHRVLMMMYGGELPPEEQRSLYIKEYVNIVCGHAISDMNNRFGEKSRLSVPYLDTEDPREVMKDSYSTKMQFQSDYGDIQVRFMNVT